MVSFRRPCVVLAALAGLAMSACCRTAQPFLGPVGCEIEGLDVSRHQRAIDWDAVAATPARFVWIKATEGGDYLDPAFRRNWLLARGAGLARGAYHFVTWCRRAEEQAAWFVANVPDDPAALPPVLDVEWNPASRSCPQKVSREAAQGMMKVILTAMERTYGRKPVIYAPLDFFQDVMIGAFADYPLWVRNVGAAPAPAQGYGDREWRVWQRRDDARMSGIDAPVDLDCFNGSAAAWRRWIATR